MTGPQEFLWEGTPSLTDDRSTRMFCPQKGHPHYMMTGRLTGTFCLKGHTLITWWQVARNFLFDEVYPHCVIIGPQEFFVQEGTPLSPDDRSTGFFCFQKVHPHHAMTGPPEYLHTVFGALRVSMSLSAHEFRNHKMTWWSKYSLWEEVHLQKWWKKKWRRKRYDAVIDRKKSNWREDPDKTRKWSAMNDGDVGVTYVTWYIEFLMMWRWQAEKLRNGWYNSNNVQIKGVVIL